jgi:heme-degrading monooxygenase HmoA
VIGVVFARMSNWTFKKEKAEEGFIELDSQLNSLTRQTEGFRGYMSLLSREDASKAVILSLWQDEEALIASEKGAFVQLTGKMEPYLEKPPTTSSFRVFSTELFQRHEKPNLQPTQTTMAGRI